MKTILVAGGTGFIGSNLCIRLVNNGDRVICVDNNYTGNLENLDKIKNDINFNFIEHDICEPLVINEKIDQIYNFACPASPVAYQGKQAIKTTKICVFGGINLLELAKENNATILQASTSEIYGNPIVHPQTEAYFGNVNPIGVRACYDEGKRCAESLFFDYHREEGVNIKVIRIFNTYGPNMDPNDGRVISNFICQALKGEDITIYGDGAQTRSFCYIDDLINVIIKMMNSSKDFVGPVNVGNPEEFTIIDLAHAVLAKIDTKSKIIYKTIPLDDPVKRKPNIDLAMEKLNWTPKIKLDQGLDKTISYFKNKLALDFSCDINYKKII